MPSWSSAPIDDRSPTADVRAAIRSAGYRPRTLLAPLVSTVTDGDPE
jgi:hypothetical protein